MYCWSRLRLAKRLVKRSRSCRGWPAERHGLDAAVQGRVLIEELACAWCHKGPLKRKLGPDLSGVGARVDAGYLKRFLLDPHTTDPGTQMPDILGMVPEDERDTTADVLTYYLKSLSDEKFSRANVDASMVGEGKKLFEKVGYITCHAPGNGGQRMCRPSTGWIRCRPSSFNRGTRDRMGGCRT